MNNIEAQILDASILIVDDQQANLALATGTSLPPCSPPPYAACTSATPTTLSF